MTGKRLIRDVLIPAIIIAFLGAGLTLTLRYFHVFESLEFAAHDRLLATHTRPDASPAITVILETEADLQRYGHPLNDGQFADILNRLTAMKPAVIAVDKYRDLPIAPGSDAFNAVLAANDNILWVAKHGRTAFDGVRPPKVLAGSERVGCADVPIDSDGRVRRYMLAVGSGDSVCPAIGYLATALYLAARKQESGFADNDRGSVTLGAHRLALFSGNEGPYADEDRRGYQVPLHFLRPLARSFTMSQVFDGAVPASAVAGKIVLFGTSAVSLRDAFDIPRREAREATIPGVMVHAAAVAELLDVADGVTRPSTVQGRTILWGITAAALVAACLVLLPMPIPVAAGLAGASILAWLPLASAFAGNGIIVAPVSPVAAGAMAMMAALAWRALREARERGELMGWFGKHVSPEVANAIWQQRDTFADHGRMPPQNVRVSVLFADIRGYTSVSEKLAIDKMIAWLNRAIAEMVAAVTEHQGVVTRFAGDQVMAVFGVPIPRTTEEAVRTDATNAVEAGLAMDRKLAALNEILEKEGLPPARVRIGIFSGEVVQALLGSNHRYEFTVLGDVVNTASRLESFATEDDGAAARVLVGGPTRDLIGEAFETRLLGAEKLKGKDAPVDIFRVLSRKPSQDGESR